MKRILAKYEGICSLCGGLIKPGMEIFWEKSSGVTHVNCGNSVTKRNYHGSADFKDPVGSDIKVPVFLVAREKYQDYQVRFYESLAVPDEILQAVSDETVPEDELKAYAQWRVDFPSDFGSPPDDQIRTVLVVAHKILTRGRITLVSPTLEKKLKDFFGVGDFRVDSFKPQTYLHTCNRKKETSIWVDGPVEKLFLEKTLFDVLGPYYRHWVIPQVHISSLVSEFGGNDSGQRVDFLITTRNEKIVVELDGPDHIGHDERDLSRDELLRKYGYQVLRIRNDELESGDSIGLQDLRELLAKNRIDSLDTLSPADKFTIAVKISHQLQIVAVEALLSGVLDFGNHNNIYLDFSSLDLPKDDLEHILNESINDLTNFLQHIAKLYNCVLPGGIALNATVYTDSPLPSGVVVTFGESIPSSLPRFCIQDIVFPSQIAQFSRPVPPVIIEQAPDEKLLEFFLEYIFRKEHFWEGQYETISRALAGKDTVVLLPTGSGKSLTFQLASMLLPGVGVVVDPIVALIEDQIDNLQRIGIDRTVGITAQIEDPNIKSRVIRAFGHGEYLFCYIAPERFQTEEFRESLRSLTLDTPVSLIAIDESHCVSEWGHDFRPSYLNLGRTARDHCTSHGKVPPLLALTGTASHAVLKDVQRELSIPEFDAIITPQTFDRKELKYSVFEAPSEQKQSQLEALLLRTLPDRFGTTATTFYRPRGKRTFSGIVFCPFVDGDFGVVKNAETLRQAGIPTNFYCGRAPRSWGDNSTWVQYKRKTAKSFKSNKFPLMVATKAFAMGIDKPNIRFTVHFGIPPSIEAFYQEAGRAGRDRERTECVLLFSVFDRERAEWFLRADTPIELILEEREAARRNKTDDDITRALFFHNFAGVSAEMSIIDELIHKLGDLTKKRKTTFVSPQDDKKIWERAVHRLVVLGVIEDYTIAYVNNEFTVTLSGIDKQDIIRRYELYISGFNKSKVKEQSQKLWVHAHKSHYDFVRGACETLIQFIYDTIEKGRRRALREMFLLAKRAVKETNCDQIIRSGILLYLETSHAEELEAIINDENVFDKLRAMVQGYERPEGEVIGGIRSPRDAEDIRGQVARYLESYPDHPGLLFLRAACEAYCTDTTLAVIVENLIAGANYAVSRYLVDKDAVYDVLHWLILDISDKKSGICPAIVEEIVYSIGDPAFARLISGSADFPDDVRYPAGLYLFNDLAKAAVGILESS